MGIFYKNNFGKFLKILVVFVLMAGWIFSGWPRIWQEPPIPPKIQEALADTQTFTTSGTWTCPLEVTLVDVECRGAGGAGGGNNTAADGGGGGGGGAYSKTTGVAVTPGEYSVTVGAGGTGVGGGDGNPGGDSSFTGDSETVLAKGGGGGYYPVDGAAGAAGAGGQSSAGTGDTKYSGGSGGTGANAVFGAGGGGGGGAGDAADGGVGGAGANKTAGAGGTGGTIGGGVGGAGGAADADGSIGAAPGGAGGGSGEGTSKTGGAGAAGKCILTWSTVTVSISRTDGLGNIDYGPVDNGGSTSTDPAGQDKTTIFLNDGTAAEKFSVNTGNSANWTAFATDPSAETDKFWHRFATTSPATYWKPMGLPPSSYVTASSSVAVSGTLNIYLRIDLSDIINYYNKQDIIITILAEEAT